MEFNPVGVVVRWIFGVPGILDPGAIRIQSLRDCRAASNTAVPFDLLQSVSS
jgi:hypothetical protein